MSPRILLALSLTAVAVAMVSARERCSGGIDVCECRPSVIRPSLRKLSLGSDSNTCSRCEMPLYSYTDPCIRQQRYPVSPAQRQSSRYTPPPPASDPGPCSIQPSATIPFSRDDHDYGHDYYPQEVKPQEQLTSAVDPVSLYLASKNVKSAQNVDEAKISYGFYNAPNHSETEEASNVREEALNTIAKRVLVLKDEPKKSKFSVDPDSHEVQEVKPRKAENSRLTYNDLGYTTYQGQPCGSVNDLSYRQSQGSSLAYTFPPRQSVERYESRCSHRKSEQSTNHESSYQYHF